MADKLIVVSDLHIGRGNNQDDFRRSTGELRDPDFEAFCDSVANQAAGSRLTLVLNGDIVDFWEIAPEEELSGPGAVEAIRRNLVHSLDTPAERERATAFAIGQLDAALGAHPGVVRGLRRVLDAPGARVAYVFGNHDHAMVNPRVQARLVDILNGAGDVGAGSPEKLSFGFYHEDPELRAYAEHGNQFSGEESAFRDPADWTEEALGYYVLRFAWNRYQNEHNVVAPSTGAKLSLMFRLLFRQGSPEAIKVLQYFIDYFLAFEDGLVPKIAGDVGMGIVHNIWRKRGKPKTADGLFSRRMAEDLETARAARRATASATAGLGEVPGEELHPDADFDRYTEGLIRRFRRLERPFPDLDPNRHFKLLLGHTHQPRNQWLFQNSFSRQRYINCGTWTREAAVPMFGYVASANWKDTRGLREFR